MKMKHNKWLCFIVLLLIGNTLFAISRPHVTFDIRNFSNYDVIVNMEFWYGPGSNFRSDIAWLQTISGVRVTVRDMTVLFNTNVIPSNHGMDIIQFTTSFLQFDTIISIPFMDKMRATFKRLEIIHDGGRRVITLESLEEIEIIEHISRWEAWYVLEIFDW